MSVRMVVWSPVFRSVAIRAVGREVRCVIEIDNNRSAPHTARSVGRVDAVGHAVRVYFRGVTLMWLMLEHGWTKVRSVLMLATV